VKNSSKAGRKIMEKEYLKNLSCSTKREDDEQKVHIIFQSHRKTFIGKFMVVRRR
jgi:hypothetical protein